MSFNTQIHQLTIRQEADVIKYFLDFTFTNDYPFDVRTIDVGSGNIFGSFLIPFSSGTTWLMGDGSNFQWPDTVIRAGETLRFNGPELYLEVPFNLDKLQEGLYVTPADFHFDFSNLRAINDPATILEVARMVTLSEIDTTYYGCVDQESTNYNPDATIDNGICRDFFIHPDSYYEDLRIEAGSPMPDDEVYGARNSSDSSMVGTMLVGETPSGPAFQNIQVSNWQEYQRVFGSTDPSILGASLKYPLSYYAKAYLQEGDNLIVQRVLGKGGYDAGSAFRLLSKGIPYSSLDTAVDLPRQFYGDQEVYMSGFPGVEDHVHQVLGVLRSRADYQADGSLVFRVTSVSLSSIPADDMYGVFRLNLGLSNGKVESYEVSLDPLHKLYIGKVLGYTPSDKPAALYVDELYDNLIRKMSSLTSLGDVEKIDRPSFREMGIGSRKGYTHAVTPWIVSEVRGSNIDRLFRLVSLHSGSSAGMQVKISITNIDPITSEFDLLVRDFNDQDEKIRVLESYRKLSLSPERSNFILKAIGDIHGAYTQRSKFVSVELNESAPVGSVPAGFEGYYIRNHMSVGATGNYAEKISSVRNPSPVYKKSYQEGERVNRTYLGWSDKQGIETSLFKYFGDRDRDTTKTYGFHLEAQADNTLNGGHFAIVGKFMTGEGSLSPDDLSDQTNLYHQKSARKFTVCLAGGFDGWDEHRKERTTSTRFMQSKAGGFAHSDYYAYQKALERVNNPSQVAFKVLSTPNLNFVEHEGLVRQFLDMVENERADALYLIEAPEYTGDTSSVDAFIDDLSRSGLDSSYAAIYFPYIKIRDNRVAKNLWISPIMAVVRSLAYTDVSQQPWFAAAGMDRGMTDALDSRVVLTEEDRNRIRELSANSLMRRSNKEVVIWGNRTLLSDQEQATADINVRRLLLEVQRYVQQIAQPFIFEQHDTSTRREFEKKMQDLAHFLTEERGVYEAQFRLDPEEYEQRMTGVFSLKPTGALEVINIRYQIVPTGISFEEN